MYPIWEMLEVVARGHLAELPIGYFGASTGASAAIVAAARMPEVVRAVASRGGRPDLASEALGELHVPRLLIGGLGYKVIGMNERALEQIVAEKKHLEIVPGVTHLFDEPGTLERAAELALGRFRRFLGDKLDSASNDRRAASSNCGCLRGRDSMESSRRRVRVLLRV